MNMTHFYGPRCRVGHVGYVGVFNSCYLHQMLDSSQMSHYFALEEFLISKEQINTCFIHSIDTEKTFVHVDILSSVDQQKKESWF